MTIEFLFSTFGYQKMSANGTQFTEDEFKFFCKDNNIVHLPSPPYHPQSNGKADRFLEPFKRAMKRSKRKGQRREFERGFC